jgi:RNA polymerase sigma-70 factor (ECF subfamily)
MENRQAKDGNERADADLVAAALHGDGISIRDLIQKYNRRLYRIARSIVGDDAEAEEVLQEGYLRAFSALGGFRGDSSLATWLTRIVVNEALQRLRYRKSHGFESRTPHDMPAMADVIPFPTNMSLPDPEMTMAQREICALVERAIDDLPQEFRSVLVARTIEGMSVEETATALGLKAETVKTRLHRARHLLKAALDEHLEGLFQHVFPFDGVRCQRVADAVIARLRMKGGNLST